MPVSVPLFVPAVASTFAILVVKGAFGGLGNNWMNPAMAGIAFAWLNWPESMKLPVDLDSAASLWGLGNLGATVDARLTSILNFFPFSFLGATLPEGYVSLLLGFHAGAIGELSGLLLLVASSVLIARRVIRWQIPAAFFLGFAGLQWIFGGIARGEGYFGGDVLEAMFSGPFFLVSFFMATDPVTSPAKKKAMLAYGLGAGALAFLIGTWGSRAGAMAFALIIMNTFVPLLEDIRWTRTMRIGS
jgi:electron transport complex protein RnfD